MTNFISSRTPEGTPNYCPVCKKGLVIEPSTPSYDAPCPNCGTLLWFLNISEHSFALESSPETKRQVREALRNKTTEGSPLPKGFSLFSELEIDSLDIAELLMELDEGSDS